MSQARSGGTTVRAFFCLCCSGYSNREARTTHRKARKASRQGLQIESMERILIRSSQAGDFPEIIELSRRVYCAALPWSEEQLASHRKGSSSLLTMLPDVLSGWLPVSSFCGTTTKRK